MGTWKALIPIGAAIAIAAMGSFVTYQWAKQHVSPQQAALPEESQVVKIAVAAVDLPWGTQLTADKLTFVPYLKKSLPAGSFTDAAALENRVVIFPVKQSEPILESRLAPPSISSGGMAAVVKPGYRALAVKGDNVLGLSGLIRPGNRVDVLVTYSDQRTDIGGRPNEITKVVLENILVLATGSEVSENRKGETQSVDVYTLEVTPEDGEKLALAATQGRLHFALRNSVDAETVLTRGATIAETLSGFSLGAPVRKAAPAGPGRTRSVEVINGKDSSVVTF